MRPHPFHTLRAMILGLTAAGLSTAATFAQEPEDPERLAPPDAAMFIRIDDLASHRVALADDPLFRRIAARMPLAQEPHAWRMIQEAMGMSGEQIIDHYFGRSVALIARRAEDGAPGLLLSRIAPEDAEHAVDALALADGERIGRFTVYPTHDGMSRIGFSDRWMAMTEARHADYMRSVLRQADQGPSLADDEQFVETMAKLPERRDATIFARNPQKEEMHAAALLREGPDLALHYVGRSPDIRQGLANVVDRDDLAYGPLPAGTLAAVTLNAKDESPDPNVVRFLDRLLAPRSFRREVLPKLGAPVVLFLGETPAEGDGPAAPVLGAAIRLGDPEVAADLRRAMDNAMLLANIATLEWSVDPIEVQDAEHHGTTFRVANLGRPLAQRFGEPRLGDLARLAYGRIGDWYVISTEAAFHRRAIEAHEGGPGLGALRDDLRLPIGAAERPVGGAWVRSAELAANLRRWAGFVEGAAERPDRADRLREAAGVLEHYRLFTIQLSRDGEHGVRAEVRLTRE